MDVRVILAGAVVSSSIVRPTIGPFHQNVCSAHPAAALAPRRRRAYGSAAARGPCPARPVRLGGRLQPSEDHLGALHATIVIVDDRFAAVGPANFFSRSMAGVDTELTAALVTTGDAVRDLRVRLWAEHLHTPITDEVRTHWRTSTWPSASSGRSGCRRRRQPARGKRQAYRPGSIRLSRCSR